MPGEDNKAIISEIEDYAYNVLLPSMKAINEKAEIKVITEVSVPPFNDENAEKAASVPPPKPKTYDDIEKEVEEVVPDPMDTRLRKKPQFPAGAFLKRERLDSEGRKSLRYQGMPIRV